MQLTVYGQIYKIIIFRNMFKIKTVYDLKQTTYNNIIMCNVILYK